MSPSTSPSYFFFFFLLVVSPTPTPTERSESSESSLSLSLSLESVSLVSLVSLNIYKVSASSLSLESVSLVSASKQVNGYNSSPVRDTAILDADLNRWCESTTIDLSDLSQRQRQRQLSFESVSLVSLNIYQVNGCNFSPAPTPTPTPTPTASDLSGREPWPIFQFSNSNSSHLPGIGKLSNLSPWEGIIILKPHQTSKKVSGRSSSPERDRGNLSPVLNRWYEQRILLLNCYEVGILLFFKNKTVLECLDLG